MNAPNFKSPRIPEAAWVVACRVVGIGATLAGNVVAARLLEPAGFGLFLLVSTLIALGGVLAMGGFNEAGLRFISESLGLGEAAQAASYLASSIKLMLGVSLAAAVFAALGLLAFLHSDMPESDRWLIVALAPIGVFVLAWQQAAAEWIRGYGDLPRASFFSGGQAGGPISNLLFLAALVVVATRPMPLTAAGAVALLVGSVCATAPFALWSLRRARRRASAESATPDAASPGAIDRVGLLAAAGSLLVIQVLTFATYQFDIWIGGTLLDAAALGVYGVAKRCQLLAQLPVQMAMMAVIGLVPRLHAQNRPAELERLVRRATTLAAVPSLAALALLALFPESLPRLIFGQAFVGVAPVIAPLLVGQLVYVLLGNPGYVLNMTGHHTLVLWVNVAATAILIVVGGAGAASRGPEGLAAGSALAIAVQSGLLWWFARRRLGLRTHVAGLAALGLAPVRLAWWPFARRPHDSTVSAPDASLANAPAGIGDSTPPTREEQSPTATALEAQSSELALAALPHGNGAVVLRQLWWLHPAWPFAGVVGATILAAWWQNTNAYRLYGTPKYITGEHVLLAFGAIVAFALGLRWANRPAPRRGANRRASTAWCASAFTFLPYSRCWAMALGSPWVSKTDSRSAWAWKSLPAARITIKRSATICFPRFPE